MSFHGFSGGFGGFDDPFLPRERGGFGGGFGPSDILPFILPFLPGMPGGGQQPRDPRPSLPMPGDQNGPGPAFGTCRNTRNTKMPPTIADNGMPCCPSGWHLSRTKDPCTGNSTTCCVKNRRTNFGNMRASTRAVRRVNGTIRHLRKLEKAMSSIKGPTKRRAPKAPPPCK